MDRWYDPRLDVLLRDLSRNNHFDVVIVEYVVFPKPLRHFGPGTRKVIDTIDMSSGRHQRTTQHGLQPGWYSATEREEARALRRADVVVAISAEDRSFLSRMVRRPVVCASPSIPEGYGFLPASTRGPSSTRALPGRCSAPCLLP